MLISTLRFDFNLYYSETVSHKMLTIAVLSFKIIGDPSVSTEALFFNSLRLLYFTTFKWVMMRVAHTCRSSVLMIVNKSIR